MGEIELKVKVFDLLDMAKGSRFLSALLRLMLARVHPVLKLPHGVLVSNQVAHILWCPLSRPPVGHGHTHHLALAVGMLQPLGLEGAQVTKLTDVVAQVSSNIV